jgi:nickel transport system permease protein
MGLYLTKRLASAVITLFFVSFLAFVLINLIPSDPAEVALRVGDTIPTAEAIAETRLALGLDKPFLTRYYDWLGACLRLDFGVSFTNTNRLVGDELARALPFTIKLAALALLITLAVSIPVGVLGAVFSNHWIDKLLRVAVFAGTSMPNFWLAFLLIWLFSIRFDLLPSSGATSLRHFVLPATALSAAYIATYIRLIRNSMLENMRENYVLFARARGLPEFVVICKHVLKNSLQSSMTAIGMGIVRLLAGTVVIENVFSIPGLGRLCLSAIFNRDYPVIQAYILVMGCLFVLLNLLVDVLHCVVDPRLKRGLLA